MKTKDRPSPHREDHHEMSRYLMRHGFGAIDDKDIFEQLAFMVTSHELFRAVLQKAAEKSGNPADRAECYKALAPRLRFKAHPLEWYVSRTAERAEARLRDPQHLRVERAIEYEAAKLKLVMECGKCLDTQVYPCRTTNQKGRDEALRIARNEGWVLQKLHEGEPGEREIEVCPKCPAYRGNLILTDA